MLCHVVLLSSFLFSCVVCLPKQEAGIGKKIVSQEVDSVEENSKGEKAELVQLVQDHVLKRVVDDDTGKVLPGEALPGAVGVPHLPAKDKNFARRMSESQWHKEQPRLHKKAFPEYKRVMHNRNTINDNRHDRRSMKIPRHPH
ncbi:uncharacterized protein LOC129001777 [Macrosteles quadrilineatus]|uniref:uncharacterized protein LOC129001777 n=1 Tax=Macrosteles quadrilineatus TaxID=74068 RepID=UPI0023E092E2|nr:uncharacterized protein LOC129001777 [Macrosteles quadrilineatus]